MIGRTRVASSMLVGVAVVAAALGGPRELLPHVAAQTTPPTCDGLRATIVGTPGPDVLRGTPDYDVIVGGDGADRIIGGGGIDVVCADAGTDRVRGGPGRDRIFGGSGRDVVRGGRHEDAVHGQGGRDRLRGGSSADDLSGGTGRDVLVGGGGDDTLLPGWGRDRLRGGAGADLASFASSPRSIVADLNLEKARGQGFDTLVRVEGVIGSDQDDVLRGDPGANLLAGRGGRDVLVGGRGDDLLGPGSGTHEDDTLRGGPGTDLVTFALQRDFNGVTVDLSEPHDYRRMEGVQGTEYEDDLAGTEDADRIEGLGSADTIDGRGGDDSLFGGGDTDTLTGGAGDDRIWGGDDDPVWHDDKLIPGPGDDSLHGTPNGRDFVDYGDSASRVELDLETGVAVGEGRDAISDVPNVVGSRFDDILLGSSHGNMLFGEAGNDLIGGRDHHDQLRGGPGDDDLRGGAGRDSLQPGAGADLLQGDAGADELWAQGGSNVIGGGDDDDVLYPAHTSGALDHFDGGAGTDRLELPPLPTQPDATIDLAAGIGTWVNNFTLAEIENVTGGRGDDTLSGDERANLIDGDFGEDVVHGRGGDDELRAGPPTSPDHADGGAGTDLCRDFETREGCEFVLPAPPARIFHRPEASPPQGSGASFAPRGESQPEPAPASQTSVAFQANAAHSGYLPDAGLTYPLQQTWSREFEWHVSYPVIVDGRVFVTVNDPFGDNLLYAFDSATGAELWRRSAAHPTSITYGSGRVYQVEEGEPHTEAGTVRALDPSTGALLWERVLPFRKAAAEGTPVVDGDDLYVPGVHGGIYALGASDGQPRWMFEIGSGSHSAPALSATRVYGSAPYNFFGLARADGDHLWLQSGDLSGGGGTTQAYHEGRVYTPQDGEPFGQALDAVTGEERGWFPTGPQPAFSGPTGFFVYDGALHAHDLYGSALLWDFEVEGTITTSPLVVGDVVLVGSREAKVFAVDIATGEELWRSDLPRGAGSSNRAPFQGLGAGEGILAVPAANTLTVFAPERR